MSLLDDATSYLGPLTPANRARILAFLDGPTLERWRDVRSLVVSNRSMRRATIWQNVIALNASYWDGDLLPDAITVARAIQRANAPGSAPAPLGPRHP